MAKPEVPPRAKLFIGILFSNPESLEKAVKKLIRKYGAVEIRTSPINFDHTSYYDEIGHELKKIFLLFKKHIERENIVNVKLYTNRLEEEISGTGRRIINIDPGYITLSNVFLASCKEFYHRTYLGKGIYLENEYRFASKQYSFWEWTYPDYKKQEYLDFFYAAREIYHRQIREDHI